MLLSFCGSLRSRSGTPGRDDRVCMTLHRRERDSNRRSLSSESARARLAAGGNGIRTVSPSPVRVGLFAACGKFAALLDLFMTPWWRKTDSNCRSPPKTGGFSEQASSTPPAGKTSRNRGIRPERDRWFESVFLHQGVSAHARALRCFRPRQAVERAEGSNSKSAFSKK